MSDWKTRAACRDEDPELFFPISSVGAGAEQIEEARQVCRRCPVRGRCLEEALDRNEKSGIWGATTPEEREKLRRRRMRRANAA